MSFAEIKDALPQLSSEERETLIECLQALEEGVSVEEFRALRAAIDEALMDPSPLVTLEEVYDDLKKLTRSNAAST